MSVDGVALMTTTTTGTGSLTVAAVTNWPTIQDKVGLNRQVVYGITDATTGAPICYGVGQLSGSTTLVRGATEDYYSSGVWTEGGTPLSLSAGTKNVSLTALGKFLSQPIPGVQASSGTTSVVPNGLLRSNQTKTLSTNVVLTSCLEYNCAKPIVSLSCEVTTLAGTGSDRIQLGVYECKPDGTPGNLLMRTGDLLPNTTGVKTGTIAGGAGSGILPPGWYWFAIASSTTPAVRAFDAGADSKGILSTPMGNNSNIYQSYAFFAAGTLSGGWTSLPSTITLGSPTIVNGDFAPMVVPRV